MGGGGGKILDISGGGWVIFPMKSQKFYGSFVNSGSGPQLHFRQNVYKFFIDLFTSVSSYLKTKQNYLYLLSTNFSERFKLSLISIMQFEGFVESLVAPLV